MSSLMNPNKETKIILSLSSKPGSFGTIFHNFLYKKYKLNYFYKANFCEDINSAILGMKSLDLHGFSISMPFKQQVIQLIDSLDTSAKQALAVNTIINTKGKLQGFCTDWIALEQIMHGKDINRVLIFGSGAMAEMVNRFFSTKEVCILARNEQRKKYLDESYGNKSLSGGYDLVVNATPVFSENLSEEERSFVLNAKHYYEYPIGSQEELANKIGGLEITKLQAKRQFELYTGVSIDNTDVEEAFRATIKN